MFYSAILGKFSGFPNTHDQKLGGNSQSGGSLVAYPTEERCCTNCNSSKKGPLRVRVSSDCKDSCDFSSPKCRASCRSLLKFKTKNMWRFIHGKVEFFLKHIQQIFVGTKGLYSTSFQPKAFLTYASNK